MDFFFPVYQVLINDDCYHVSIEDRVQNQYYDWMDSFLERIDDLDHLEYEVAEERENEQEFDLVLCDEFKFISADIPDRIKAYRIHTEVEII